MARTVAFLRGNGLIRLMHKGEEVGRIVKYTQAPGWGVFIPGVYWAQGRNPTTRGGSSGASVRTANDGMLLAGATLQAFGITDATEVTT